MILSLWPGCCNCFWELRHWHFLPKTCDNNSSVPTITYRQIVMKLNRNYREITVTDERLLTFHWVWLAKFSLYSASMTILFRSRAGWSFASISFQWMDHQINHCHHYLRWDTMFVLIKSLSPVTLRSRLCCAPFAQSLSYCIPDHQFQYSWHLGILFRLA